MHPFFAQIIVSTATNAAPASILAPSSDLVNRISASTRIPIQVVHWGANILAALAVLVIGFWIANIFRNVIKGVCAKRNLDLMISGFVGNLVHALLMTFVVITALGTLGLPTQTFSAVVAAAGLAIGLALQGSLSNFASGFLLVAFRPFKKGDHVVGGGIEGIADEVSIFSTTITTPDNKRITVPNSAIMGGTISNFTANPTRRIDLHFGIGAGQSLEKAHQTLLASAATEPRVLKTPATEVSNAKLVEGGTLVELRAWCKTTELGPVTSSLIARTQEALAAAGIKGPDKTIAYRELK